MPELQSESDLEFVREKLKLDDRISEEEALEFFRRDFDSSLKQSYAITTNWWIHTIKQLV